MLVSFLIAAVGFVLTGTQAVLIYLDGSGICLNEGCEVVDSLTRIAPLYFNIVGLFFFLLISFGLSRARRGSDLWKRFVSLLLLAALAAEAVLFAFQQFITQIFCSYCLIVLAIVFLCNLFMGLKQLFKGIIIFAAVFAAMASLNFSSTPDTGPSLDGGTLAQVGSTSPDRKFYLFFSSSCVYCEKIIETLKENNSCAINFNPLDRIDGFSFPEARLKSAYSPEINRDFLKNIGIPGIPVFLEKQQDSMKLFQGESAIRNYLEQNCSSNPVVEQILQQTEMQQTEITDMLDQSATSDPFSALPPADGCLASEACEEPGETNSPLPQ